MHLKSITLKGFKSFASPTTFHLEPGVTCVVGPNGSGKSNVVDALAWVMGEQGAKSLRGGKMEDVIFSGSSGRAPLGRAEVSLTIDNADGALPIEYSEVTISRTLFRNGGSEYAINGEQCRLLDIQELLSDSGIGREMHVIVGQGQLDSVLQATPEDRRGFIEEAAGVLKHRKRKEKALRKLDAMAGNLARLQDLTTELRRQLKPLGRQAEVARRAVVIQTDVRDARLRLYADDLLGMRTTLDAEVADETALLERRAEVEAQLATATAREAELEELNASTAPELGAAQETWFKLSSLRERTAGMISVSTERVRLLAPEPEEERVGRDPDLMEAEARSIREEEFELSRQVEAQKGLLAEAETERTKAEAEAAAEDRRVAAIERAASDRREGLARLTGQVNSAKSRIEARDAELERLSATEQAARERGDTAQREFHALEVQVAGLDEGEIGLDAEYETAQHALIEADARVEQLRRDETEAERDRASLAARLDALEIGLNRKDAAASVVSRQLPGVRGSLASLLHVEHGAQAAVAAALGQFADAVVVGTLDQAVDSLVFCKQDDAGRVSILVTDESHADASSWGMAPEGGRWLLDAVTCSDDLRPTVAGLLQRIVYTNDLGAARSIRRDNPQLRVVTGDGDLLAPGIAQGGSGTGQSLLEVQAAYDETAAALADVQHRIERAKFDLASALESQRNAAEHVEAALAGLHESDARMAAVAEQLGQFGQTARAAAAEADRVAADREQIVAAREADARTLAELEARLASALAEPAHDDEPDRREELAALSAAARAHEVEQRLAVRTSEERVEASKQRAEQLERAAASERQARAAAIERRERRARELIVATAVLAGAKVMLVRIDASLNTASRERTQLEQAKSEREAELTTLRARMRELSADLDVLKDTVHRDEVARAEQRLRIEQLVEKVLEEFGIESEVLVEEYGPSVMVPPSPVAPGDEVPEDAPEPQPYPYVREEQEKRLRSAEKQLALLGRVNPLALEEFAALEERLVFLTEQLDDLKRSRDDLLAIVKDVDERVQQVFSEAFADVAREFEDVFSRMFPGGDGRLILTDPSDMLNTGVDVEARPPGKKVKRLSLLSGGERSLAAVAFLVALFKARPSPFYVLDEVEAALDDVNLGRLLDIIAELRDSSQLIVITHQKRTMEIADALYGVSMRGDGVTQVIGQRLHERDEELAPA